MLIHEIHYICSQSLVDKYHIPKMLHMVGIVCIVGGQHGFRMLSGDERFSQFNLVITFLEIRNGKELEAFPENF